MIENSWPLTWPAGWPRARYRQRAPFKHGNGARLSVGDALRRRLLPELERLGARSIVVSLNVRPHLYDQLGDVADPGVAAYFDLPAGGRVVLACDKWDRAGDNVAAIAAHVEALRGQERWGVGSVAQAFAGYKALAAVGATKPWWEVLGLSREATADMISARRRLLLEQHHPDKGGNPNTAAEVNAAYQEAMHERRAP